MSSASGNDMTVAISSVDGLELQAGDLRLAVRADLGGCIAGAKPWQRR
jgi:hypothetical protein